VAISFYRVFPPPSHRWHSRNLADRSMIYVHGVPKPPGSCDSNDKRHCHNSATRRSFDRKVERTEIPGNRVSDFAIYGALVAADRDGDVRWRHLSDDLLDGRKLISVSASRGHSRGQERDRGQRRSTELPHHVPSGDVIAGEGEGED